MLEGTSLTQTLLEELDLFRAFHQPTHVATYIPSGFWAKVAVPGHTICLADAQVVFLKDCSVKRCQGFDEIKAQLLGKPTVHLFKDLQQVGQEIKFKETAQAIAAAPPPKSKRPILISSEASQPTIAKRLRQTSPSLSPSQAFSPLGSRFTASPSPIDEAVIKANRLPQSHLFLLSSTSQIQTTTADHHHPHTAPKLLPLRAPPLYPLTHPLMMTVRPFNQSGGQVIIMCSLLSGMG